MAIDYKIIGKNVQVRRKHLHVTQQKMADDLYLSASLISKLERGAKAVSLDTLSAIADYLNTTPAILLTPPSDPITTGNTMIAEINVMLEDLEQPHLYIVSQLLKTYYDNIKSLRPSSESKDNKERKKPEES